MTARKPLVIVAGQLAQLPVGDVIDSDMDAGQTIGTSGDAGTALTCFGQAILLRNTNVDSTAGLSLQNDARTYTLGVSGGLADAVGIYDNTASAWRLYVLSDGRVVMPSIPRNPSAGTIAGYATGTLYADASGFLKIK
jgi:hypothetical protein